jgi:DNA-binding beta-propeller fold protein YncE
MVRVASAQGSSGKYPVFEPDPDFPKIPNGWTLGSVAKVVVDRHDNVWIIHRPRTVPAGKTPAPPVLEFDSDGKFIQAWGGDGAGYDWPDSEHNVFVDYKDNVWISGSSPSGQSKTKRSDDMLLKFTNSGKFLMQVGGRSVSLGSKDPKSVNKPGDLFVSAKTNEVYVADGYGNRRVIVFDADTGAFKRMWGAFGKPPEDDAGSGGPGPSGGPLGAPSSVGSSPASALDTEGPGSPRFGSPVHGVMVSNDNIVYVADRSNRRVQLFTPKGKYLRQLFVNRAGPATDSACGFAHCGGRPQETRNPLSVRKKGTRAGGFPGAAPYSRRFEGQSLYSGSSAGGARRAICVQRTIADGAFQRCAAGSIAC